MADMAVDQPLPGICSCPEDVVALAGSKVDRVSRERALSGNVCPLRATTTKAKPDMYSTIRSCIGRPSVDVTAAAKMIPVASPEMANVVVMAFRVIYRPPAIPIALARSLRLVFARFLYITGDIDTRRSVVAVAITPSINEGQRRR